jgi:hypothetical protein
VLQVYTTKLDISKLTEEQIRKAERLAKEIEGNSKNKNNRKLGEVPTMYSGRLEERLCATGLAERGVFVCVSVCLRHTLSLCGRGQYEDRDDDEVPPQPAPPPPANNTATFPALGGGGNAPAATEPEKPQSAQPPQQSAPVDPAVLQMGPYASVNSTVPAQVPCKCIKQGSASLREGAREESRTREKA